MLAADLRLAEATVRRHIRALVETGRVEEANTEPGYATPYQLTPEAQQDRAMGC